MATREGNLVLSFFMGPVLTALAWAPFVGNAGGEGVCVWGEEEPPKDPDPDPKKPLMY
ncbi:hypothetical protein DACRYDRAFT_21367 [Dacryopinax primogenitus]|uniref:Uncharacterized protein n=1 Tax=Dacryopinax primogenitus (strain DJM 731) TaxID=1858805 RepID=M5GAL5_DACPD|nr:uncharacterized protein DACRYDRAFT_21367 [Dacryopinax primogenitus]EJU03002.1 hypothetical protein DACRYDRAFT_21367 [Dacryopinax primogenitus]